ncbi:hypothetical protein LAG90_18610 [Marinilongibacter aquaticus]|uniref:hypothetical protein n=1 Tax=Marinilongibacter aquaticus TaxID=2975157 RepID=UPI0021BD3D2E|nr:hypothetical protein [Marinilongibacter aquaticus]UBM58813.1 hypothetical protein LAG90_18610 [Marinilongibacter aquaticus]
MNASDNTYLLEWIDLLVSRFSAAEKSDLVGMGQDSTDSLLVRIRQETQDLKSRISHRFFSLGKQGHRNFFIRKYHATLTVLLAKVMVREKNIPEGLKALLDGLQACLEELITYIGNRYAEHLSMEEQVSASARTGFQKGLRKHISDLRTRFEGSHHPALALIFKHLERLAGAHFGPQRISYRTVSYTDLLVAELKDVALWTTDGQGLHQLDKVLIYLNFNSKAYIRYLLGQLDGKVAAAQDTEGKLRGLKLHLKAVRQIHPRPKSTFNPQFPHLHPLVCNWLQQEIEYYSDVLQWRALGPVEGRGGGPSGLKDPKPKVLCNLSTDQIALILRSADEAKVLEASSMSMVFKTIVPFLRTPRRKELSHNGVRSRMYNVEEGDKEVAIKTLERMIMKIREY